MKKCPFCAESIQDDAILCRFCGKELTSDLLRPAKHPSSRVNPLTSIIILALTILIIVGLVKYGKSSASQPRAASNNSQTKPAAPPQPQLEIVAERGTIGKSGYAYVEGEVKNLTETNLDRVQAVVTWYTDADKFITSDSSFVEYQPILPGQISPFKVMTKTNPEMKKFKVVFSQFPGAPISTKNE